MSASIPGDTSSTALLNTSGLTSGTLDSNLDSDWYQVTLTAGYSYDFTLSALAGSSADVLLALYDSLGNRLTYGGIGTIDWEALSTGTYFIAVTDTYQYDNAAEGGYSILANMTDDVLNTTATTTAITATGNLSRTLGQSDDVDYIRVSLQANKTYDFRLSAAQGTNADMLIALYDSLGNRLTYDSDGGNISWSSASAGTFYVVVSDSYAYDSAGEGGYTISSRLNDDYYDIRSRASAITGSGVRSGTLGQSNDEDWFKVNLVAGRHYGFKLTGDGSGFSLDDGQVSIVDSEGNLLSYAGTGDTADWLATSSGTYYISVADSSSYDDAAEGNYRLTSMLADTIVGNTATTVALAANGSLTSRIDAPGDSDWVRVQMREGLAYGYTITTAANSGVSDPDVYLRDATGGDILVYGNSSSGTTSTISWTATAGGQYYVQAGNVDEDDIGGYVLRSIATDSVRGDIETAARVLAGERISGRVDVGNDTDFYRISTVAGQTYTIQLSGTGANALPYTMLALYNADGQRLYLDYGASGDNATVTFTATSSGPFYIGASSYAANFSGNFTLAVGSTARNFTGSEGNNNLTGNAKANLMSGLGGNDLLQGLAGNDTLKGGSGHDTLWGGLGADRLLGEAGNDVLDGQAGNDALIGGIGLDQFVFRRGGDSDRIADFTNNADTIRLIGLGVSTVNQALAKADQVGASVVFDFGQGDRLTVVNTTIAELRDDLAFV